MKKYIVFIAVSSLLFCSSCTSFLEEPIQIRIPASTFLSDQKMILQWLRMVRMQL